MITLRQQDSISSPSHQPSLVYFLIEHGQTLIIISRRGLAGNYDFADPTGLSEQAIPGNFRLVHSYSN
jgi:hypothetical protein